MTLDQFQALPLWKQMAATVDSQETAMVEKHVSYILPQMEHYTDTFPTYTLHNREHIYNVIRIMGQLLGDRVTVMHGLEAMILILSAVYHDYGMIYSEEERQRICTYENFNKEFLIEQTSARVQFEENGKVVSKELAEWYCRWAHAVRVWPKLEEMEERVGSLEWKGMPIGNYLGYVCESHNEPAENIRIDDSRFKPDLWNVCDLRFCALLLRLADILDFDNSRSPQSVYDFLDLSNPKNYSEEISKDEWNKHMASRGFMFPPQPDGRPIKFLAAPPHPYIEQGIRNFLDLIDLELSAARKVSDLCSSRWQGFSFPESIDRSDILSNNYLSGKYRFSLSEDKILDLLTGDDLYSDDFVFIRELLQNAIDTVRHRTFIEKTKNTNFKPNPIEVSFFKDSEGYHWLRVDDQGMGMDRTIIESHLLKKGNSYYHSDQFKLEKITIKSLQKEDFVPISRFGIGLLSCFITCDKIEISTCYYYAPLGQQNESTRLSIEGRGGYWVIRSEQLHHKAHRMPHESGWQKGYRNSSGTSIACRIKTSKEFRGLNMAAQIERFLLAPEIPVLFQGKPMGGSREELTMKPWCEHSKTAIPAKFLQQCSELLKSQVESIVIEVRPIDLARMAASHDLTGQLVVVIPRIKVNNVSQYFSTAKHFKLTDDGKNAYLICEKKEIDASGREVKTDVRYEISEIIASIHFPDKFLERIPGHNRFIWPRISHNGIVVHDDEQQLKFILPAFDQYYEGRHTRSDFYLATGLFSFRDALLPQLAVSRSTIKRFTIEIIAHVLYATREMNEYKGDNGQPFSYIIDLESKHWRSELYFSVDRLEKTGLYEKDRAYWHSLPCLATKTEKITIDRAIELCKAGSLAFRTIQFQSKFFTEFVKYMVIKNFLVRFIPDEKEYYLEGQLPDQSITIPSELRAFEPMQFIDSRDAVKVVLKNRSFNLKHPLIKWYIKTADLIQREFSYYGIQLFNGLLSDKNPVTKAEIANEIIERLRVLLPETARPARELNITEHQL